MLFFTFFSNKVDLSTNKLKQAISTFPDGLSTVLTPPSDSTSLIVFDLSSAYFNVWVWLPLQCVEEIDVVLSGHCSACVTRLPCTPSVHAPILVSSFSLYCLYLYSLSFPSVPSPCATCAPFIDATHSTQQRAASTPPLLAPLRGLSLRLSVRVSSFFLLLFYLAHSRLQARCPLPSCRILSLMLCPHLNHKGAHRGRLGCREWEWRIRGTCATTRGEAVADAAVVRGSQRSVQRSACLHHDSIVRVDSNVIWLDYIWHILKF